MKSITIEIEKKEYGESTIIPKMVVEGELTVKAKRESEIAGRGADQIEDAIREAMEKVVEESYDG